MGGAALANKATAKWGGKATKVSVLVHAVSWIAQFVGHGKFEGRAPALLVSFLSFNFSPLVNEGLGWESLLAWTRDMWLGVVLFPSEEGERLD